MKFPSALSGIKKLFVAEIISIIATLVALVSAIILVANLNNEGAVAVLGTLGIVAGVALIVAFVLEIVGLIQGSKDEDRFRIALFGIIISLVLTIGATILGSLNVGDWANIVADILSTISTVISVLVTVYILLAIGSLAGALGNDMMVERGQILANWVIILFAVSILLGLFPNFFILAVTNPVWRTIFSIFAIVAALVELLVYINILIYYYKAIKMLSK